MKKITLSLVLAGIGVASLSWGARQASASADIVGTAVASKKFPTLVKAIEAAGLAETLKGKGPFTVFAPTEGAFRKLPKGTLESLLRPENKARLAAILTYHVVPGKVMAADVLKLKNGSKVKTVNGESIVVRNAHGVQVDNAKVVKTDIECTNGVIHVIDNVILPRSPQKHSKLEGKPGRQAGQALREAAPSPVTASYDAVSPSQFPKDATITDLRDGYTRVETSSYSIELPAGWEVSAETPWGQRKAQPKGAGGELGVMTAPPGRQSWDQLYRTSLYFILRESGGNPTPYRLGKTPAGLETASFEVLDDTGFAARRYVLIRNSEGRLLALSVRVPNREAEREWAKHFERLKRTARFMSPSA